MKRSTLAGQDESDDVQRECSPEDTSSTSTADKKTGKVLHGAHYRKRTIRVVFFSLLIELLGFTVILPLLPSILEYYGRNDKDGLYGSMLDAVDGFRSGIGGPQLKKFNIVLFGGLIGSLFSFLQFFSNPLIGALSDIYGRKPLMLLCMVGMLASYALWAVSHSFIIFILARIIGGISHGNVSLCTAIVADICPPKSQQRARGMAMIGIAFSVGFILGPIIGALFSVYGVKSLLSTGDYPFLLPALFAVTMAFFDVLYLWKCLPETLLEKNRATSLGEGLRSAVDLINPVSLFQFSSVLVVAKENDRRSARLLGLINFLYLLLFSGLEYSLTFLTHDKFNYSSMEQGRMFFFIGITMALVQGGYLRRQPAGTEKKTAMRGIAVLMPGMILVGLASSTWLLYLGLAMYSFGAGTVVSSLTTLISEYGNPTEKGRVMGIFRSLGALARALGPGLCCSVYWSVGPFVCYMLGSVLFILPLMLLRRL